MRVPRWHKRPQLIGPDLLLLGRRVLVAADGINADDDVIIVTAQDGAFSVNVTTGIHGDSHATGIVDLEHVFKYSRTFKELNLLIILIVNQHAHLLTVHTGQAIARRLRLRAG